MESECSLPLIQEAADSEFLGRGAVSTSPKNIFGELALVGCLRLLVQYIRSYSPYWRPFLHLQSEDAQCHDNRTSLPQLHTYWVGQNNLYNGISLHSKRLDSKADQ